MKNWPHQILDELLENYSESPTDLTRFCIDTLKIEANDRGNAKKIKDILVDYSARGYLEWFNYKWIDDNGERRLNMENNGPNKTRFAETEDENFSNNRIEAHLTSVGLDYALKLRREREQHESIILTNESSRLLNKQTESNYKSQKLVSSLTIIIAALAALFSALAYFKDSTIKIQDWQNLINTQNKIGDSIGGLKRSLDSVHNVIPIQKIFAIDTVRRLKS